MARPPKLTQAAVAERLGRLEGWELDEEGRLWRRLRFPDFPAAMAFLVRVAFLAEAANHHPDWSNSYDRVDIRLTTHDVGGLTELDFALADKIGALAPGPLDSGRPR